jgi:PAS domain S-box-containing protein
MNRIIQHCNPAMLRMLGYTQAEVAGKNISLFSNPEDEELNISLSNEALEEGKNTFSMEKRYICKDGKNIWSLLSVSFIRNSGGVPEYMVAIVIDITELKEREKVIATYQKQLQTLMYESTLLEERERKRIADVLHDTIGQHLVFSKLKLSFLLDSFNSAMENQKDLIKDIIDLITQTVEFSRSLTYELCSPVLYLAGFEAAVKWLAEQIQKNYGIACELTMSGSLAYIKGETGSLIYRTLRELVYNVVKHAKANRISITIRNVSGTLEMDIADNGVGFDPTVLKNYGLFSVTERVKYLGQHP